MALEDFTTYTEVDEDPGDITVIATKVSWTLDLDDTSYVYKDFGAGFFGNFSHDFEANIISADSDGKTSHWAASNHIAEYDEHFDNSWHALLVVGIAPGGSYRLYCRDMGTGNTDFVNIVANTLYYCTIDRTGTTLTLYVYSDAPRTVLVGSAAVTCTNTTFRYLYGCMSTDEGSSPFPITAFTQNLDIKEGIGAAIYFFDGTNNIELQRDDSSPVQMYNGVEIVGLKLGATNDANASPFHTYDGTTIKAILKMP